MAQAPKPTSVICRSELPSRRVCIWNSYNIARTFRWSLFVAKDGGGIRAAGPQGGEGTRDEGGNGDQHSRRDEDRRVVRLDAEEQRRKTARGQQRADGAEHD